MKISFKFQKQEYAIVEFRNYLFIPSSQQLKNKFLRITVAEELLLLTVSLKISFLFSLFMQQQTHSSVKISRPFLMKRLENVVGGASCEAQRIPSSSSAGNLLLRIIRGWVLLVKHMANVVFYFQSHIDILQFKDIYISIRTD